MPPIDTTWFRTRLAEQKLSQRGMADRLGIDPAALSLMLRGKRTMKIHEAVDIARLLGVPMAEVLFHAGIFDASRGASIAITGWLDPHGEVHFEPDLGQIDRPHGLPADAQAIHARTAGSDIDYMDGWLLFIGRPDQPPLAEHLGRLCIVRMTGGVVYLAQLRRGYTPGRWNLAGPVAQATDVSLDWSSPILTIKT